MSGAWIAVAVLAFLLLGLLAGAFMALAMGRLHLDLGIGRSLHELGPLEFQIDADPAIVYEILSAPYTGRARNDSIDIIAADESLVVAAHLTKVHFYESRTVEAVQLEPPSRIGFRHLTGPVPHAIEEFVLEAEGQKTVLRYRGELGIDYFVLGRVAARHWVIPQWIRAVDGHLKLVTEQAELRAERSRRRRASGTASK